jgi:aryl carrier-like protein
MVPAEFVFVDAMPVTPNGKIDRGALPRPTRTERRESKERLLPRTAMERQLAEIWAEVLGIKDAGVNENFFSIGGNSLRAVQVVSRIRTRMGRDVPLRAVFEAPTIAEFAEALEGLQDEEAEISSLLAEIEHLTDEQASSLLGEGLPE